MRDDFEECSYGIQTDLAWATGPIAAFATVVWAFPADPAAIAIWGTLAGLAALCAS